MSFIDKISKEDVYKAVKKHGPIIPYGIRQKTGKGDSTTIGAALSELTKNDRVESTKVKKGSSPFYYVPEDKEKLEDLKEYLGEKDRRAVEKLKQEKVLRDNKQKSIVRVGLRNTPDYSKKLIVNIKDEKEVFWRYYLVSEEEAVQIIRDMFTPDTKEKENTSDEEGTKKQTQKEQEQTKQKPEETQESKEGPEETQANEDTEQTPSRSEETEQKTIETYDYDFDDDFFDTIETYLKENNIAIQNAKQKRKNRDYELDITVPTSIGELDFYCRCRRKKKLTKGDVSRAYIQGVKKQKPTLLLTTGEAGTKTKEEIDEEFEGLILVEL